MVKSNFLFFYLLVHSAFVISCSPGNEEKIPLDGDKIPSEIVEKIEDLPIGKDSSDQIMKNHEPLPSNGIIEPRGSLGELEILPEGDCDCSIVRLGKMETKTFTGFSGWGILSPKTPNYTTAIHYEIDNSSNPPESGEFTFPRRNFRDQMCFYFTYPSNLAYWGREGGNHPCKVLVEIKWPTANSTTGFFTNTWQLYGIRGVENFATGNKNYICYISAPEGFEVVPGIGEVRWSVNGRICSETVLFRVI